MNTSGEVETQLHEVTEQATWFKKVTPSAGSSSDLLDLSCFGSWGPCLQSARQSLGIILLIVRIIVMIASLVCCVLSKALPACI